MVDGARRGRAFGGKTINEEWVGLGFCALFFIGLANLRRPLSLRNLDLLALLSFSISLRVFNGEIFGALLLAYPPPTCSDAASGLAWSNRPPRAAAPVWPVGCSAAPPSSCSASESA